MYTFDYETHPVKKGSNISPIPVGVSIKKDAGPSHYYSWGHPTNNNCTMADAIIALSEAYASDEDLICHNSKFDLRVALEHFGIPLPKPERIIDTMIMAYLIDAREASLGLKDLAQKYCFMEPDARDELHEWIISNVGKSNPGANIYLAPGDLTGIYAEADTDMTYALYMVLKDKVIGLEPSNSGMKTLSDAFLREQRLMPVIIDMEMRGITVSIETKNILDGLESDMNLIDLELSAYSGGEKPNTKAMFMALRRRGLIDEDRIEYTPKGNPRYGKDVIMGIVNDEHLGHILKRRSKLQKLIGTYVRKFYDSAMNNDGKFYPYYNQTRSESDFGTRTGRLCIAKDSEIQLLGESKKIQDVVAGDMVYSFDEHTNLCASKVLSQTYTGNKEVIRVHWKVNGSSNSETGYLDCTPDHRIRLIDGSYVEAQNLKKNDRTLSVRREQYGLTQFINGNHIMDRIEVINRSADVYDLEIQNTHCFIANEICVHNSSDIQQLPKDTGANTDMFDDMVDDLPSVRSLIVPSSPSKSFVKFDFSGQELRVAAHYAEGKILQAYIDDPSMDVHKFVEDLIIEMTGIHLKRTPVKMISFLKLYGGGPKVLSERLKIDFSVAQGFFQAYDTALPEFKTLMADIERLSRSGKKIVTWGGRGYDVEVKNGRQFYYKLGNILIQGSSADMTKEAMIRYHYHPDRKGDLVLTVHDELVVEVDDEFIDHEANIVQWAMNDIPGWDVPLKSDGCIGKNLSEMKDYENK